MIDPPTFLTQLQVDHAGPIPSVAVRQRDDAIAEAVLAAEVELVGVPAAQALIQKGSPPAATTTVRVSERRARLLGLDEPTATRTELSGRLSVAAKRFAAERELFLKLDVGQLEALAAESQALVDKALRW